MHRFLGGNNSFYAPEDRETVETLMRLRNEMTKDLYEFRRDIKKKEGDLLSRIVNVRQTFADRGPTM